MECHPCWNFKDDLNFIDSSFSLERKIHTRERFYAESLVECFSMRVGLCQGMMCLYVVSKRTFNYSSSVNEVFAILDKSINRVNDM